MKVDTCKDCPYFITFVDNTLGRCIIDNKISFSSSIANCYYKTDFNNYNITQLIFGLFTYYNGQAFLNRGSFNVVTVQQPHATYENVYNVVRELIKANINKIPTQLILIGFIDDYGVAHKRTTYLTDIEFYGICDAMKEDRILRFNRFASDEEERREIDGINHFPTGEIPE